MVDNHLKNQFEVLDSYIYPTKIIPVIMILFSPV